ncbi:hypothetical protein L1987_46253 [Smallanthus sonchifolius]|uniref:Uncharacterized protein n=1 Tax=Smallanthus sonchifolius TaxID=185202 RepID=A0ACB9FZ45_9ASTR|nr:hypothetical protein L1987_46253 [Smallanthus sonchifolius]
MLKCCDVIGSSHGLLCLYGFYDKPVAVLWNVSIRKAVSVVVPNIDNEMIYETALGFGVCRETNDPKIVKITRLKRTANIESRACIPPQVEVFTLSTRDWRSSYTTNLPRKSIQFHHYQEVVDGFLYWLATDRIAMDGGFRLYNLIISFNMTSEEFREVNLPDTLHMPAYNLSMSKLRESLVALKHCEDVTVFVVWMMEDGAPKSFTKLFTVNSPDATMLRVLGFRKSGESVVEIIKSVVEYDSLAFYEPCSKHINSLGINGVRGSFSMYPYMETLLLLDHPDFIIYDKGEATLQSGELGAEGL